jgi:predicted RNA-binding Zn ribbon-like protein
VPSEAHAAAPLKIGPTYATALDDSLRPRKSYSTDLWFEPREPEDLFAPLAHNAATLFATVHRERVRKCAHCVLHFHDTSKKGTRRWCSMQLCGNRLKVAAYAARRRRRAHK